MYILCNFVTFLTIEDKLRSVDVIKINLSIETNYLDIFTKSKAKMTIRIKACLAINDFKTKQFVLFLLHFVWFMNKFN